MAASPSKNIDMLHGSISDKILRIALPLACTSILQQLFNSADMAVVGRFAGNEALAAVGANSSLISLLINVFIGLSVGSNAVTARLLGAGDRDRANDSAHTAVVVALLSGLFLAVIGQIFPRMILLAISTPEDILPLASLYLRIYFGGMPFIMLYNFTAALFRSKGDSRTPLLALTAGGVINVLLNLFFVIVLRMSVAGVAIATVLSNVISSLILLSLLIRTPDALQIVPGKLRVHLDILKEVAFIGVPAGLQSSLFSISNVILQSAINALGTQTIAANTAEITYEFLIFSILNAFTQTNVTFAGQNLGAGNLTRVRQGARRSIAMSVSFVLAFTGLIFLFARPLISIFTSDPELISIAIVRMHIVVGTQFINSAIDGMSGVLRGVGRSLGPALVCVAGICGFRLIWIFLIYPLRPGYAFLMMVYPASWIVTIIMMFIMYLYVMHKLEQHPPI